jgi:lipopolysaccharide/colanic/teichoic acid biosynthesis glycosyltransferase
VADLGLAIGMLAVALPVMALVAVLVKLDSRGPVLFRQERVGQFGRTFTLLKFRSMRADAEAAGPRWARADDPRATRIGRLLRKTHLDELPQALNVLAGDLSFVGPRPERPCFVELLRARIPFYDLRHYVKPGITGWAQVSYPYADSIEDSYEKHQYDLYYGRNVSLALDLRILAMTAAVMVLGRGR